MSERNYNLTKYLSQKKYNFIGRFQTGQTCRLEVEYFLIKTGLTRSDIVVKH